MDHMYLDLKLIVHGLLLAPLPPLFFFLIIDLLGIQLCNLKGPSQQDYAMGNQF